MLTHLIEIVILSFITCILINKLISILGSVDEEEVKKRQNAKSYFGEPLDLKDVTGTGGVSSTNAYDNVTKRKQYFDALKQNKIIVDESGDHIVIELEKLQQKISSFDINKFYNTGVKVIKLIIKSKQTSDHETLEMLLDKRFIETFKQIAYKYDNLDVDSGLDIKISNIYSLGNNAFIKMVINLITLERKEEWTFSKNTSILEPQWYLSNVEVIK